VLLIRNAYLFSTKIYENQDYAANTIAVLQAKHFQLLLGNYSKENFYHPGPAFLYVMAAGESLFHDALHLVPTPWNGQVLAILLLNAALVAAALAVVARHAGSTRVTLACVLVVLLFVALHPLTVNSPWFPYLYFTPALLMLVSAASVATGETFALPVLALSGWLCIHGQAEFLVFAPLIAIVALAGHFWMRRKSQTRMFGAAWPWIGAAVISALFALPIVISTSQHWPGQFGSYLSYRRGVGQGKIHHSLASSIGYVARFWWPGKPETPHVAVLGAAIALVLVVIAATLAHRCPVPGLRRFLLWSVAMAAVMELIFVYFAQTAVSDYNIHTQSYLGYFTWAAPLIVVLVVAAGAVVHVRDRRTVVLPLVAAVAAGAVVATVVPQYQDDRFDPPAKYQGVPQLPQLVRTMASESRGRSMVIRINEGAWIDAVGVVAYGDRTGRRACVTGPRWVVMFRSQSVCTPAELQTGVTFWFYNSTQKRVPPGQVVVSQLSDALITRQLPT
jgi:MFS family permease